MVRVIEGYVLNEVIGEGNFGSVYRATHKEKSGVYAVKVIPIEKFQQNERLQIYQNNQIEALQAIGVSEYIIRFYEIIKSKNNCYLVYEYCNGGTLQNILKKQQRLEQKKALVIFRQLLEAFKVLNKNSIMHRDLKPENIFFTTQNSQDLEAKEGDKKKVKLGDFGFCKGLKPEQNLAKTMLGSPIYMAPQVLKGESYTTKADIWSLGVILFEMLYGYCPFQSKSIASLINTIDTQPVQLSNKITVSERTQTLIKRMLAKDYFRRIGWVQLFNTKIDQNGQYVEEPPMLSTLSSGEERGSTPNKKIYTSLFGSLTLGISGPLTTTNRSYSTIRQEQKPNQIIQNQNQVQNGQVLSSQARFARRLKQDIPQGNIAETRVNSQPKDQKKFYSQNFINILTTPLSIKKTQEEFINQVNPNPTQNISINQSKQKPKINENTPKFEKDKMVQKPITVSPLNFRQERVASMDNIDISKQHSIDLGLCVGSNVAQPISFNKYRQNIGLGSRLSTQFLSDRNIKEPVRHSTTHTQYTTSPINGQEITTKRNNLLKIHEGVSKTIAKCMCLIQQKFIVYKNTKQLSDFGQLKEALQDCYVVLKMVQEKLKIITESIKITQTSLLDVASIVNYQHIQVQKFVIEVRNQLIRCSVQLPNLPTAFQNKMDRVQTANCFRQLIKNKNLTQIIDDCF